MIAGEQTGEQAGEPAGSKLRLVLSGQPVCVIRMAPDAAEPHWARGEPLVSVTRTATELSVICPTTAVPDGVPGRVEGPFVAVVIDAVLDFGMVGVLAGLLQPLADGGVPVLAVSTFDTDWLLVDAARLPAAIALWRAAGYHVIETPPVMHPGRQDDE